MQSLVEKLNSSRKSENSISLDNSISNSKTVENSLRNFIITNGANNTSFKNLFDFLNNYQQNEHSKQNYFLKSENYIVEIKISKVLFENQQAKLVSFIDCTEAQENQKLQAESKYKTLLLATISHELRMPVNAVLGALDLIEPNLPPENLKLVEIARESCNMLTFHINDLVVFFYQISN